MSLPKYQTVILFYCSAFFFLLPAGVIWGQTQKISFEEVRNLNGNSLGKINAMVQDRQGFMWFSDQSNGAIVRYDGSNLEFFNHDPENPNSLGGPYPESMWVSESGIIWIGFYGQGLDRFDPVSNTFTHYRHDPNDAESLAHDYVWAILEDHLGNIWVGTQDGLDLLDKEKGTFKHYRYSEDDPKSLSHNVVRALFEDRSGTLWVGTGFAFDPTSKKGGLNRFNRENETFTRYLHDPEDPYSLAGNKVRAILEDSYGNFWVGTDGDGMHSMDRETGKFTRHTFDARSPGKLSRSPVGPRDPNAHITFLLEDSARHVWIGTNDNGISRFDPVQGTVAHFNDSADPSNLIEANEGWSIFQESNSGWCAYATGDGLVWLSTQRDPNKVFKIDLHSNSIPLNEFGYLPNFYEDVSGVLWKGSGFGYTGLVLEDASGAVQKIYRHDPKNANSLSNNSVSSIIKDSSGKLWIGTNFGLNEFDPSNGEFKRYFADPQDPSSLSSNNIASVFEDSHQNIWVGTNLDGLNLLDRESGKFRLYEPVPSDITSISGLEISVINEDKRGNLWIGCINEGAGLNRFIPEDGAFKRYLPELSILSILEDARGDLWIGTAIGLYKYDPETDRFENTGISSNITLVTNDADNNLWLYTSSGIIRYDPQNGNTLLFGEKNGVKGILQSNSWMIPYRKQDGTLLFGSEEGYYSVNPKQLYISRDSSLLKITDFRINSESALSEHQMALLKSDHSEEGLTLAYDQRDFSIFFTSIDYRNSQKNMMYTLENYDPGWLKGNSDAPATYFKVPPGDYVFRIKTVNNSSGIASDKRLGIVILPPWWATWWAYGLYALLLVLGILFVHRFQKARVIRSERERAKDNELQQAREIEKAYKQLKSTQQQLLHSEKMASLGELTAGIAHEIKNPLNFVNNFSEVSRELLEEMKAELKKGDTKEADAIATDVIQNLEKIVHHGQRADSIVRGMLQHSRSGDGKKEPTDLNTLADEYLRLAYHGLRAKDKSFNAAMEMDFDPELPQVNIVPQDIGRVLLNLITNAFHAVGKRKEKETEGYGPTVWVTTRKSPQGVEISVRDNGGGIPDNIKDKIFQPFFTTKPTGEGTGLGLSMAYDIVTKGHGGELKLSESTEKGTEFTVWLPAKTPTS
ncbi:MAG: two-component regulator propeller domain-containing protein [Robiginitalea sp.]